MPMISAYRRWVQEDQESKVILSNSEFEERLGNVQTYYHMPGNHLSLKQFRTHHLALWPPKELQTLKRLATSQQPSNPATASPVAESLRALPATSSPQEVLQKVRGAKLPCGSEGLGIPGVQGPLSHSGTAYSRAISITGAQH